MSAQSSGSEIYERVLAHLKEFADGLLDCPHAMHPLGFARLDAGRIGDADLRIHIWPEGQRIKQRPNWAIHTHLFLLESMVLVGKVTNIDWDVEDDPVAPTHRLYAVRYQGQNSVMDALPRTVRCRVKMQTTVEAGGTYRVEVGRFHSSEVEESRFVVTAVKATRNPASEGPFVVGSLDGLPQYSFQRTYSNETEARQLARRALAFVR